MRRAAVVLAAGAVLLAGCGGGDSADPTVPGPTTAADPAAYVTAANAACRRFAQEKADLRALIPRSRADVVAWLDRSAKLLRDEVTALRAIPAPESLRTGVEGALDDLDAARGIFTEARTRISEGEGWQAVVADALPKLQARGTPAGNALADAGLVECAT